MMLLVLLTGVSVLTPHLRVEETAASNPAVTVRRPVGPLDTPVLLGVLLVAGLMLPDIRRIRFGPAEVETSSPYTVGRGEDVKAEDQQLDPKAGAFLDALKALGGDDDPTTRQEGEQP